jgi:hypothetical protein
VGQAELDRNRGIYVQDGNKERWRLLCEQASVERDPEKLHELIEEINRLLDEKSNRLKSGTPA